MRNRFIAWILLGLMVFPVLSFAQMKPGIIKPIQPTQKPQMTKPPITGKTYWCAEVNDVLFREEPKQGQKLNVGVRVKFTKQTVAPGQKLCNCAFEGPTDAPVKFWSKAMSLRLIGVKYSETETNLLEYHHAVTPVFIPRSYYSGFEVIGFRVTENDLKRGYIDVWGWGTKEPLQCRDAYIYVTLDVNGYALKKDNDPDYLNKGCFPSGDFVKKIKPKCLQMPKIPEGAIKEVEKSSEIFSKPESGEEKKTVPRIVHSQKEVLRIPLQKFEFVEKLRPIPFEGFKPEKFKKFITLKDGKEVITLKEKRKTIWVQGKPVVLLQRPTKTIEFEKFLQQVNDIEAWLNKSGYSLKDKEPIKIRYIYPRVQFDRQRDLLKHFKLPPSIVPPPQVICEGYSEGYGPSSGPVTEPVPLEQNMEWSESFGDKDFGVELTANMTLDGKTNAAGKNERLDINPYFSSKIYLFGIGTNALEIKKENDYLKGYVLGEKVFDQSLTAYFKDDFNKDFQWSTQIQFPVGPVNISGEFGFKGGANAYFEGQIDAGSPKVEGRVSGNINANAYGEIGASYEIVTVGVGGEITLLNVTPELKGSLSLPQLSDERPPCFNTKIDSRITANLLSGRLYVFGEIDYFFGEKQIEIEFFNFEGINFKDYPLFSLDLTGGKCVPATKDRHAYLVIDKIHGIRDVEIKDFEPLGFELVVNIGGNVHTVTLKDYNKSGIYGDAIGEYENQIFEIPLLSYKKVPISIEVKEKYKIGTLEFTSTLDFAKGEWKKVELCYDPGKKNFKGTVSGKENETVRAIGDTNYWGERIHGIEFSITPSIFKPAPAKAR